MANFFDPSKSQLTEDTIFVVDAQSGKGKTSGKDYYKVSFVSLSRDGKKAYCSDKFVDKSIFDAILNFGYYRVKVGGVHGDWISLTPVKVVSI